MDTQTIPPARANYAATALQSIIFDFYQEDYARKLKEKEDEKPKRVSPLVFQTLDAKIFDHISAIWNATGLDHCIRIKISEWKN